MPDRCFVPNCRTGYPPTKKEKTALQDVGKVGMFKAPKNEELFKRWKAAIPRIDAELNHKSKVCSLHFEEDDIIKERTFPGKDGQIISFKWINWKLKEDAIPRIFPGCPSYLSKPKNKNKRKPPAARLPLPPKKTKRSASPEHFDRVDNQPDEGCEPILEAETGNEMICFDPTMVIPPPGWYWIQASNLLQPADAQKIPLCVTITVVPGNAVRTRSVHVANDSAILCLDSKVVGKTELKSEEEPAAVCDKMRKILHDFDAARVCSGVQNPKYSSLKSCTGGINDKGEWRSTDCQHIINDPKGKPICTSCYTLKRALGRLISKPAPLTLEEKLLTLREKHKHAKQDLIRKANKISEVENKIILAKAEQQVLLIGNAQMRQELKMKEAVIKKQADEIDKIRRGLAEKARHEEARSNIEEALRGFIVNVKMEAFS